MKNRGVGVGFFQHPHKDCLAMGRLRRFPDWKVPLSEELPGEEGRKVIKYSIFGIDNCLLPPYIVLPVGMLVVTGI